jgi:hypothetical protein
MSSPSHPEPFPVAGILPKDATQADEFLLAHPTWDGRGIVVAVFDTGVGECLWPAVRGVKHKGHERPPL